MVIFLVGVYHFVCAFLLSWGGIETVVRRTMLIVHVTQLDLCNVTCN